MVVLQSIIDAYLERFPAKRASLSRLQQQLTAGQKLNDRRNFHGHAAGSGIVLSADRSQILLIHHKVFNKWMQPGGHWESDDEANPLETAEREVKEETGLANLQYLPLDAARPLMPLDIDTHPVPARPSKDEPAHWHHDFRYVFLAGDETLSHQIAEVNDARWFDLEAPETAHVRSIIVKLQRKGFIS